MIILIIISIVVAIIGFSYAFYVFKRLYDKSILINKMYRTLSGKSFAIHQQANVITLERKFRFTNEVYAYQFGVEYVPIIPEHHVDSFIKREVHQMSKQIIENGLVEIKQYVDGYSPPITTVHLKMRLIKT